MRTNKNLIFGASAGFGLVYLVLLQQKQRRLIAERQLDWLPVEHDEKEDDKMLPPNRLTFQKSNCDCKHECMSKFENEKAPEEKKQAEKP